MMRFLPGSRCINRRSLSLSSELREKRQHRLWKRLMPEMSCPDDARSPAQGLPFSMATSVHCSTAGNNQPEKVERRSGNEFAASNLTTG